MRFKTAAAIEEICWYMRLADQPRAVNRALINRLVNGSPPYTEDEVKRNNIVVNANDLNATRLCHDARSQLANAFQKTGNLFTARTDYGPQHRRAEHGVSVTNAINKIMKRSLPYYETQRSQFALQVLHGIGPAGWEDADYWTPEPLGVEDVLMPSNTKLTFKNLPFFTWWRSFTPEELYNLTHGPRRDPGWQMDVVDAAIDWAWTQTVRSLGTSFQTYWSPERLQEQIKQDGGFFGSDQVQTIDCFDFYWFEPDAKQPGWRRRIIFDGAGGYATFAAGTMPDKNLIGGRDQFIYDPGDRCFASRIDEILHFQFADLSSVAPFRYHSVRSLGFLLYAVCHLQNRLRCKFTEATFETLMNYMRVSSKDDVERALKIELASQGIIDESVRFLSPEERWQPNAALVEAGLRENDRIIDRNSSGFTQDQSFKDKQERQTKFEVQAKLQAATSLVGAALQQAYRYELAQYQEIFRRFCRADSIDPDVREFRLRCMKAGVPEKMLAPEAWDLEPERVMGSGNKMLEIGIAQQLMEWRAAYSPSAQQQILRDATLAITDDAGRAQALVPQSPPISDDKHDAMLAYGSLMAGGLVEFTPDQSATEIVETLLAELAVGVQRAGQTGKPSMETIQGFANVAQHIERLIQQVAGDKAVQGDKRAKRYSQALGKLMNDVKALAQSAQQQQQYDGQLDPKDRAKIMATLLTAQSKREERKTAHAQRTAERQISFENKERQSEEAHQFDLRRKAQDAAVETAATDLKAAAEIRRTRAKPAKPADADRS